MPLPPVSAREPVLAQRWQERSGPPTSAGIRVNFSITCPSCKRSGSDGAFSVFPDSSFRTPAEILAFVSSQVLQNTTRKCPECHTMAPVDGVRAYFLSKTVAKDLVVDHVQGRVELRFFSPTEAVETIAENDPRLLDVALDSCERAGAFLAEMKPDELGEALVILRHAASARPTSPLSQLALARVLVQSSQEEEALVNLRLAAQYATGSLESALELGRTFGEIAVAQRDPELLNVALDWYGEALRLSPNHFGAKLAIGKILLQTNNLKEAEPYLLAAAHDDETSGDAVFHLGVLCMRSKRYPDALSVFTRLSEAAPDDPDVQRMRAWALSKCGQGEEAKSLLATLLEANPMDEESQNMLALIESDEDEDD